MATRNVSKLRAIGGLVTYVNNPTECTDGIRPVNNLSIWLHILHDTASRHDNIVRHRSKFLYRQVHHLP